MIGNLLLGLGVMVLCLFVQALLVVVAIQYYVRHGEIVDSPTAGAAGAGEVVA